MPGDGVRLAAAQDDRVYDRRNLLSRKHPAASLTRAHLAKERGRQINIEQKSTPSIFAINLGQEFKSLRARDNRRVGGFVPFGRTVK